MITRQTVQGCCGTVSLIFIMDKPVRKNQLQIFKDHGYLAPDHFYNSGIFYVQKAGIIASCSFGISKVNVRCSGNDCEKKLDELQGILEQAINS